ncbi:MAG: response regulator transcription factor [Raoultibacter sp.]
MNTAIDILIIEDDADINTIVASYLSHRGFRCTQAFSGSEARLVLQERTSSGAKPFDLVITDLMLPGLSGQALVELIRAESDTPIIVTSALDTPTDKINLFDSGADDYMVKPFDMDELLARIHVQLRHVRQADEVSAPGSDTILHKEWIIDVPARSLIAAGEAVQLTRLEFNIVETLARHPKKVFTKQELFESAWMEECFIEEKSVNVHISNIRTKLKPSQTDHYIETVWGIGFKLAE